MHLTNVLISPVISEKSTAAQSQSKFTFKVNLSATKIEIAKAVSMIYGVKVESVNIIPVLKKTRMFGRGKVMTKRPQAKKALVTLKKDQTIDFNQFKSVK